LTVIVAEESVAVTGQVHRLNVVPSLAAPACVLFVTDWRVQVFPAASVIGVFHVLAAAHVTPAFVATPVASTRASGVLRADPVALFQCATFTTPAVSLPPIGVVLLPTKSMLIVAGWAVAVTGTI